VRSEAAFRASATTAAWSSPHRIGTNYEQLPVNAPKSEVHSYNKDGAMTYRHAANQPVYAPNSYGGPQADPQRASEIGWSVDEAAIGRYPNAHHAQDDDFTQAGTLIRDVMNQTDRDHLASNIVTHASDQVRRPIQERVVAYWAAIDRNTGAQVAAGLGVHDGTGPAPQRAAATIAQHANRA
jgi:catalase